MKTHKAGTKRVLTHIVSDDDAMATDTGPTMFRVEYAKTGRGRCHNYKCRLAIDKGTVRVGQPYEIESANTPGKMYGAHKWFHLDCAHVLAKQVHSLDQIESMDQLSTDDQARIAHVLSPQVKPAVQAAPPCVNRSEHYALALPDFVRSLSAPCEDAPRSESAPTANAVDEGRGQDSVLESFLDNDDIAAWEKAALSCDMASLASQQDHTLVGHTPTAPPVAEKKKSRRSSKKGQPASLGDGAVPQRPAKTRKRKRDTGAPSGDKQRTKRRTGTKKGAQETQPPPPVIKDPASAIPIVDTGTIAGAHATMNMAIVAPTTWTCDACQCNFAIDRVPRVHLARFTRGCRQCPDKTSAAKARNVPAPERVRITCDAADCRRAVSRRLENDLQEEAAQYHTCDQCQAHVLVGVSVREVPPESAKRRRALMDLINVDKHIR